MILTNKEAIKLIEHISISFVPTDQYGDYDDPQPYEEALGMAIEALSVEAVQLKQTDALIIAVALRYLAEDEERHELDRARAEKLRWQILSYGAKMSAKAIQRGEWVWDEDAVDWGIGAWCCSECGSVPQTWWSVERNKNPLICAGSRFCGNCGARMYKGGEDE